MEFIEGYSLLPTGLPAVGTLSGMHGAKLASSFVADNL